MANFNGVILSVCRLNGSARLWRSRYNFCAFAIVEHYEIRVDWVKKCKGNLETETNSKPLRDIDMVLKWEGPKPYHLIKYFTSLSCICTGK